MEEVLGEIVSIIIVTKGKNGYLGPCLDSIRNQSYLLREVIIIDNSLNPILMNGASGEYSLIKMYSSTENLFYCKALNKGIGMSKRDFILCLNDDVTLDKEFIKEALNAFDIDKRIGMVSGKILRSDRRTIDSTGLFLSIFRTAKERGYSLKDKGQYEKEGYIFGVNGAVAFYRRAMLEDIKIGSEYFDTDYRLFYEDLDIAWRAQNSGWRAYYTPLAIAYHARGATVRSGDGINKPFARRYLSNSLHLDLIKNRHLTIIKNESFISFMLHLPFILFYDFLVYGYILFFKPSLMRKIIINFKYFNSAFKKRISIRGKYKFNKNLLKIE